MYGITVVIPRMPRAWRPLVAWARADNTPETLQLAARRFLKRWMPEQLKSSLRKFR